MSTEKTGTNSPNLKKEYKKKTYKLRGISYMSLSISYIAILIVLLIIMLITVSVFLLSHQYIKLFLSILFCSGAIFFVYNTGIKYGTYGLEIMIGKALQRRHIKNDFPIIRHRILYDSTNDKRKKPWSEVPLFPNSSLLPKHLKNDNTT